MSFKPLFGTPLNRDHPLSRGLVAAFLFNEGTGKYVWDATGNGNDGICTNMADPPTSTSGWGPGPHGGALSFRSANPDYVDFGSDFSSVLSGSFSIICRISMNASPAAQIIFGNYDGVDPAILNLERLASGNIRLCYGLTALCVDTGVPLGSGFNALVVTRDIAAAVVKVYKNGALIATNGVSGESGDFTNGHLFLGRDARIATTRPFDGVYDSASIYDRALSAEEVAYLHAFPYCMFEEEAFPAWMIPPLASGRYYRQLMAGGR